MTDSVENNEHQKFITSIMIKDMTRKLVQCLVKYQGLQKSYFPKQIEDMSKNNTYTAIIKKLLKPNNIRDKLKFHDNYKNLATSGRNLTMKETEELRIFILQKLK